MFQPRHLRRLLFFIWNTVHNYLWGLTILSTGTLPRNTRTIHLWKIQMTNAIRRKRLIRKRLVPCVAYIHQTTFWFPFPIRWWGKFPISNWASPSTVEGHFPSVEYVRLDSPMRFGQNLHLFLFFGFLSCDVLGHQPAIIALPVSCSFVFLSFFLLRVSRCDILPSSLFLSSISLFN